MKTNLKTIITTFDMSGLLLSIAGILLGILLAAADYHIRWDVALALVVTVIPIHIYMVRPSRWSLAASVLGAVLTMYLSYGTVFCLESLLLLLFGYFILRLAKGAGSMGAVPEFAVTCLLKGPVALFGAYFVCTHAFPFWFLLFPALSLGLLSVASDALVRQVRWLVTGSLTAAMFMMLTYSCLRVLTMMHFLYVLAFPAFIYILVKIYTEKEQEPASIRLSLALSSFAFALLAGLGFIGYLF